MYKIKHNKELNILEFDNSDSKTYAKINLNEGASLQVFTFKGLEIIKDLAPLTYKDTYASAILFPFANRIKDGSYTFNDKPFQFNINQIEENNALHGLVYDKTFQILETNSDADSATVILEYTEEKESVGFPYSFSVTLKYTFNKNGLSLEFSAKNTSDKPFPFTLGWHPYFSCEDLHNSTLYFDSTKKLIIGDRNIGTGIENIEAVDGFQIKDQQLDDCWILNKGDVVYKTPNYQFELTSSVKNNFLQAYTPPSKNVIAIEPTTGVSDSFNNKIGLQTLAPNSKYNIIWTLKIDNN
ncbi:aldose 1-epimerase [Tamlana sp. 2_MG-2023]|uniref:aldose 1-epimerase n=1 Tax=unclassified Tamlana TaxID=2614803 RepID=UPI0026E33B1D|nr:MULTISPECIES: aldose 1-epimerase [unclassified Tamlana]MDO6758885.1 aldose 1-epimerase [Tamlana sp. 2_MG-2023]MDO6789584.1 aldose 1-epimerase [Tamlana sp. 1_MG-2023]